MNDQIFMKSSVSPSIEEVFHVISDMQSSLSGGKMDGKLFYAFFIKFCRFLSIVRLIIEGIY